MSKILKFTLLSVFLISGCTIDLATKEKIKRDVQFDSVPVIENYLNFTYTENHAIAFGFLRKLPEAIRKPTIFLLPLLSTFFFIYMIWRFREKEFSLLLPIFIILAGAYGNIVDRALNGFVTDFLHVHYYFEYNFYVFNIADVLVNVGLVLIVFRWRSYNSMLNEMFGKNYKTRIDSNFNS